MEQTYLDADVFVCTSSFENYGMAAREAVLFGLPIVSHDVGEVRLFSAAEATVLVPVGDSARIAAELLAVTTDPQLVERRTAAARAHAARETQMLSLIHISEPTRPY